MRIFAFAAVCAAFSGWAARSEIGVSIFVRTGQPVPSFTSDARLSFLDVPFITPGGDVLFAGDVFGTGLDVSNNTGIFFGKSAPELVTVARETGNVQGISGVRYFELSSKPVAAPGGRVAFAPGLSGSNISEANDGSVFAGAPGALELVAREGQIATDTSSNFAEEWIIFGGARTSFDATLRGSNDGRVGFRARLGSSPANADTAFYTRSPGALPAIVAWEGAVAPGASGAVYTDPTGLIFADTLVNGAGVCVFRSFLAGATITSLNNEALYRGPAGGVQLLFRRGDVTPIGNDLRWANFIPQGLNDSGDLLFTSQLQTSGGVTPANDSCLWSLPQGDVTPTLLIREGNTLPGSTLPVFETTAAVLNSSGAVAVQVTLGTDFSNGTPRGIWIKSVGAPFTLVARTGQACPGLPAGIFFQDFDPGTVQLDASGHIAFRCTVGANSASAVPSVWARDNAGQLRLVARVGDVIQDGSTPRTVVDISSLNINPSGGEDGRNRVLSSAGKLVFLVQLNAPDGANQAIILGDLTGPPNTPPTAGNDDFNIRGASRLAVTSNDTDPDGDRLQVVSVSQPAEGRASLGFDFISYTPGSNFDGEDSFSYTISDGRGGTATATVTVHSPFVPVHGTFTTTVSSAGSVIGTLTVSLTPSGVVTGTLNVAVVSYAISGLADFDLQLHTSVSGGGKPPLDLTLSFGESGGFVTVTGSGTSGSHSFDVTPGVVFSTTDLPQAPAGRYTFLLPGGAGVDQPHGTGWLSLVVRKNGTIRATGRLPDNVPIAFSTGLRVDGTVPVTVRVYRKPTGSLRGELTFGVPNTPAATGALKLIKPAGSKPTGLFQNGFTLEISTAGNLYTPPANKDFVLKFSDHSQPLANARFTDGDLSGPLSQQVLFARGDKATANDPVAFPVKVKINRATGMLTGNFTPPGGVKTKFTGTVVNDGKGTEGVFAGEAQTGVVSIQPN